MDIKLMLSAALLLSTTLVPAAKAQGDAGSQPGYVAPDERTTQENKDEEDRPLLIQARRERRLRASTHSGSPNRQSPRRTYPGDLPEKNATNSAFDLDDRVIDNPGLDNVAPSNLGRTPTPDTLPSRPQRNE